jgi:site-specific DNA recombinase
MTPTDRTGERAAIYVRVSDRKQEDNHSLDTQEAECRDRAVERGYAVDPNHIYREIHSGFELYERKQMTALRAAFRNREFDVLVAHDVDRLGRNQAHQYIVVEEIEHAGGRVEFVLQNFEDTAIGRFMRSAKAFAAEVEREKFMERSMRGRQARARSGKLLPSRPIYGYRWRTADKSALDVDDAQAAIVLRIFRALATGGTATALAYHLTEEGVPTPKGGATWSTTAICFIARNPAYIGQAYAFRWQTVKDKARGERIVERPATERLELPDGTIPPIVDLQTFVAANTQLGQNRTSAARNNRHAESFLLRAGLARCGYCGNPLAAATRKGRQPYYRCVPQNARRHGCPRFQITADELDSVAWAHASDILADPARITQALDRLREDDPVAEEIAAIARQLSTVTRKQANITAAIAALGDEEDAAAPLVAELHALAATKRGIEAERERAESRREGWQATQAQLRGIEDWCRHVASQLGTLTYAEKRTAVEALGLTAKVYRVDHAPRYVVEMDLQPVEAHIAKRTGCGC